MDRVLITPELIDKLSRRRLVNERTVILSDTPLPRNPPSLTAAGQKAKPSQPPGFFNRLPPEIWTDIVLRLDIISLMAFRRVNRVAKPQLDSVPQYRKIALLCPRLLHDTIRIKASCFDLQTLWDALHEPRCALCGYFGGYIYLITCARLCFWCSRSDDRCHPVTGVQASKIAGRSIKELRMQGLPHVPRGPRGYFDTILKPDATSLWDRSAVLALRAPDAEVLRVGGYDPRRYMVIVSAPYLELSSDTVHWMVFCLGCMQTLGSETDLTRQYTRDAFVEHLVQHGHVVRSGSNSFRHVASKDTADTDMADWTIDTYASFEQGCEHQQFSSNASWSR